MFEGKKIFQNIHEKGKFKDKRDNNMTDGKKKCYEIVVKNEIKMVIKMKNLVTAKIEIIQIIDFCYPRWNERKLYIVKKIDLKLEYWFIQIFVDDIPYCR